MPAIDARFAVLALFCCLSAHWFSSAPTAHAAVISRGAQSSDSPFKAYPDDGASYSQHVFPWSRGKPGVSKSQDHSRRWLREGNEGRYKVRAEGLFSSNPFHRLADTVESLLKGHHKRSHKTIAIPNDHGSLYVLSHSRRADTPQWVSMPNSTAQANATTAQTSSAEQGQPGFVEIQSSPNDSEGQSTRIASLVLQLVNGVYVLNASQNNRTRLYLVNAQDPTTRGPEAASLGGDNVPVSLEIPDLANSEDYCATYDPNPNGTEPITMQPCLKNNASDNAYNASSPHVSQTFLYNQRSGQIQPTWFSGEDDGTDGHNSTTDGNNATTTAQGGNPRRPGSGSPQSPQGQRPGFGSQDLNPNPNARNVTLIFVPAGGFGAADVTESNSSSVIMATTTTTVTIYASATGSGSAVSYSASATSSGVGPSQSGMGVEAVGGVPVLGSAAPALPIPVPVSPPTPGVGNSSASASSSASTTSSSASASSIGAAAITASPYASSSSSYASASSASINATAIAASIAASADASWSSWSSASAASATGTSTGGSPSSTYVAAVLRRGRMPRRRAASPNKTPVSTDPYSWRFKADTK